MSRGDHTSDFVILAQGSGYYPYLSTRWPRLARAWPFQGTQRRSRARELADVLREAAARIRATEPSARMILLGDELGLVQGRDVPGLEPGAVVAGPGFRGAWRRAAEYRTAARQAREIWLVYPDALGLGALSMEILAVIIAHTPAVGPARGTIWVYTGRSRNFELNLRTWLALLVRRVVVKTWAVEILACLALLVLFPLLCLPALCSRPRGSHESS